MGNKKNRKKPRKFHRRGQYFAEWRVLKSFGLDKLSQINAPAGSSPTDSPSAPAVPSPTDSPSAPAVPSPTDSPSAPAVPSPTDSPSAPAEKYPLAMDVDLTEQCTSSDKQVIGRRIIDVQWFFKEIKTMANHGPQFGCTMKNMIFQSEISRGLRSGFVFHCNMCKFRYTIWSEPEVGDIMDINSAAVAAVMSTGGGFTSLQQIMAGMNVRCMSLNTYSNHHAAICEGWEDTALAEMRAAAEEEATLARERGDVDKQGVPLITVVADASWAKRSYRTNFSSLSGVAAIVGFHTRKVLYIGVKNRYCMNCDRNRNSTPKPHKCFKNWNGSACSMESAAIVEGFLCSEEMYSVKYARLVADGDSSVYQKIIEARPYGPLVVEKIECRNHLLRNYCTKLRDIAATSVRDQTVSFDKSLHLKLRKSIKSSVMRLRSSVTKAIAHRKAETGDVKKRTRELEKDIINGPSHVFGDHRKCADYFCTRKATDEPNHVPDLVKCSLFPKIMGAVGVLAENSKHLINDVDSNRAEYYNAAVAKLIGGKRVNFCLKGSYQARCSAAVVIHNSSQPYYKLHKTMCSASPGKFTKILEERAKRKVKLAQKRKMKAPKTRRRLLSTSSKDTSKHYGPFSQRPDMDSETYDAKVAQHYDAIKRSQEEIKELEKMTRAQGESELWREERRIRITASNFGRICRKKSYSNSAPIVASLLYNQLRDNEALRYGRENEARARAQLSEQLGQEIKTCGLFIDPEMPFLGASPDGLIGEDTIVEIKCPQSGQSLTPEDLITQRKGEVASFFSKRGNTLEINRNHKYFHQVQGQLHVTRRSSCIFAVWTPLRLKFVTIQRDDEFWKSEMETKLRDFYHHCLLPELLDPRKRRSMPLREPYYILKAQENRKGASCLAKPLE